MNKMDFCPLPLEGEGSGRRTDRMRSDDRWSPPVKRTLAPLQARWAERKRWVNGARRQGCASTPSQPFPLQGKGSRHTCKRLR